MTLALPDLRIGVRSAEVGNWQRFLNDQGVSDATGRPLATDEAFGPKTELATKRWRAAFGLAAIGLVDASVRRLAVPEGFIQFLHAKNFTPVPQAAPRTITKIIVHDMEYPETPTGAEWCAQFFAGANAPRASAHYSVDRDSVVQSVRDRDVAWHAPGANHDGIGIEHAGYARQSRTEWLDDYSRAELALSAKFVAHLLRTYALPLVKLDAAALKTPGVRGIAGHRDVTEAFNGTHSDPGPNFPWDFYLEIIDKAGGGTST